MSTELWLSKAEMSEVLGCSRREIERMDGAGELQSRQANRSESRPGPRPREYAASSLPPDKQDVRKLQEILMRRAATEASTESSPTEQMALVLSPAGLSTARRLDSGATAPSLDMTASKIVPPQLAMTASIITPAKRTKMLARYRLLQPLLDWEKGLKPNFLNSDGRIFTTRDQLAEFIGRQHGKSVRTLYRWMARCREQGEGGLVPDTRKDKGKPRLFSRYPAAEKFVLAK